MAVVALDIGSTHLKGAHLETDVLVEEVVLPTPPSMDEGLESVYPTIELIEAVDELLARCTSAGDTVGISWQRSTCLAWDASNGTPLTPIISWRDRRAEEWCRRHARQVGDTYRFYGLPLSPHYAGTKLGMLLEEDGALRRHILSGDVLFGTLDSYFVWRWTAGQYLITDRTMAARTLLSDPRSGKWAGPIFDLVGIPQNRLPSIGHSTGLSIPLTGGAHLATSIADQPAAVLALTGGDPDTVLVNIGTGTFVLCGTGEEMPSAMRGMLSGPILAAAEGVHYAIEGPINGGINKWDGRRQESHDDYYPELFCIPDSAGLAAPYWLAEFTTTYSDPHVDAEARAQAYLEGLAFRIRQLVDEVDGAQTARIVLTGGGVHHDPFITALASVLMREVVVLDECQAGLLAAARLATGILPRASVGERVVLGGLDYMPIKYKKWCRWRDEMLS